MSRGRNCEVIWKERLVHTDGSILLRDDGGHGDGDEAEDGAEGDHCEGNRRVVVKFVGGRGD
jgi:hypothetical protein